MRPYPDFFGRLELAPDADERQVRRAYARELKKIDQESDLDGFQHLRDCYEAALHWIARREAPVQEERADGHGQGDELADERAEMQADGRVAEDGAMPNDGAAPPPSYRQASYQQASYGQAAYHQAGYQAAASLPRQPPPPALGAEVFAQFHARCAALAAQTADDTLDDAVRIAPWSAALREALDDPRLLNLDARLTFEMHVAGLLAEGWQPGLHLLLAAAVDVFGWSSDRHALARLGHPGAVLDAALEQREMFLAQNPQACARQREVLARLRAPEVPPTRVIGKHIRTLRLMQARFPVLLHVAAPPAAVAAWNEACPAAPGEAIEDPDAVQDRPERKKVSWGIMLWVVVVLITALARCGSQSTSTRGSYPPYQGTVVSKQRIEEIRNRIDYRPSEGTLPGTQIADVQVTIDANGEVTSIEPLPTGASPEFLDAIARAIRSTGPFPPGTMKSFKLEYTVTVGSRDADAKAAPPAPDRVRGEPVSKERLMLIRRRIEYRPGDDVPPGEQVVRLEVTLNARNEVERVRAIGPPADPALVKAIDKAIRATGAFPAGTSKAFSLEYKLTILPKRPKAPAHRPSEDAAPDAQGAEPAAAAPAADA